MSFYKYKSMAVFNGHMPQKSILEIIYYAKVLMLMMQRPIP